MSVAYSVMLLLFLLNVISIPYPLSLLLNAPFILIIIYYWTIHRPGLVPVWLVFAAGLCVDILGGLPIGLNALVFVLLRLFVVSQRRFLMGQGFTIIWLGFAMLNCAVHLVQWVVMSVLAWHILPIEPLFSPVFLGIAFFPIVSLLLHVTNKLLPEDNNPAVGSALNAPGPDISL